jgi:hypothetical protein
MNFLQTVSEYAGLVSMVFVIVGAAVTAQYVGKSRATSSASDAQDKAINAMEARLDVQEKRIGDLTKENARLYLIFDTIKSALKSMGMAVTIDGDMVIINHAGNSIATRIHGQDGLP